MGYWKPTGIGLAFIYPLPALHAWLPVDGNLILADCQLDTELTLSCDGVAQELSRTLRWVLALTLTHYV